MKNADKKPSEEVFKQFFPSDDGNSCHCYDYYGGICSAICIDTPPNHKVISNNGNGTINAQCPKEQTLLGCGKKAQLNDPADGTPSYSVNMPDSCFCSSTSGVTCYAMCSNWLFLTSKKKCLP